LNKKQFKKTTDRNKKPAKQISSEIRESLLEIERIESFTAAEQQYQSIVENSLEGIIIIQNERIVFANPSAVKIFEYEKKEEMIDLHFMLIVSPASRSIIKEKIEGKSAGDQIVEEMWVKGLAKSEKVIDMEMNAKMVLWNKNNAILASLRNITERKALEREFAQWLWEQKTLSEIDNKLSRVTNLSLVLATITERAKTLTGAGFAGVIMYDAITQQGLWKSSKGNNTQLPSEWFTLGNTYKSLLQKNEPFFIQNFENNVLFSKNEIPFFEREKIISLLLFPLEVEDFIKGHLVIGFRQYHEFIEREMRLLKSLAIKSSIALANAELYENLCEREKELEFLSLERVNAQEEERKRIAREIHDSFGQMLTAIKFNVEILEDSIAIDEMERQQISDIKSLLNNAMAEAREISYNLMPSVLVDFGLLPALQLLCEQFEKRNNITISFHSNNFNERLDLLVETGIYRIAQEALNNIAKHSNAHEAQVQILRYPQGIRMTIEDDGNGFSLPSALTLQSKKRGVGLVSMRERASSFGGTLVIDSQLAKGTEILVDIPIKTSENNDSTQS
jgi:PAS domain S-box-containing protein